MKRIKPLALKSSLVIFSSMFSSMTFAGVGGINVGNMAFHIAPAAIPTLSTTMLMVLSLLLVAVAFRISKQKETGSNKLFVTLIGVAALLSGTGGGIKWVSDVEAAAAQQTVRLDTASDSTMGQVGLFGGGGFINYFDNPHPVDVIIDNIIVFPGFTCNNPTSPPASKSASKDADLSAPICSHFPPDNTVAPGAQCQLACSSLDME